MANLQQSQDSDTTILVVDDNPENLRVLKEMLSEQGFATRIARDGQQALRSIEVARPDLILLDVHMPAMDGYDVCRRLKADERFCDIPVIFISALGETFNKVTAYKCGAADYITKPFQFEEVHARMMAHLRTRHALAESQAAFQSSFEQAAMGMAHMALDGTFQRVNRRLCAMLGYDTGELLGKNLLGLWCEETPAAGGSATTQVASGAEEWVTEEKEFLCKNGETISCRYTLSLARIEGTREQYLVLIVEDVTEEKRIEAERRQMVAAIDQVVEAIVIADSEGAVCYVNPAWERMSGKTREDTLGQNIWPLLGIKDSEAPVPLGTGDALSEHTWNSRLQLRRLDGSASTVEATVSPVRGPDNTVVSLVVVARDITAQLVMEERLLRAQKMEAIGTLAGGIAHDFNNILSAIMGYTDIALNDAAGNQRVVRSLSQVMLASERARELVAQILAFSRQSNRETRPVRIQSIVKEALKLLRGSIPSTIDFREDIHSECASVFADPTGIHQILMNLCTNAYHAMQENGGVLAIRLREVTISEDEGQFEPGLAPGRYMRLEIQDTGHGMDEATQARIFEPYFTTKERGDGTGLGLATVHGIVTDLNGVIHVYSEPGAGSTFTVLLPCIEDEEVAAESKTPKEDLRGTERILLVDDEAPIGAFAKEALERLGYSVVVQTNAPVALDLFMKNQNTFDVVVTDQMMPQLRGTELARRIRNVRSDIPIILCSGFAETMRDTPGTSEVTHYHVMKPIIAADLARAIRTVVDSHGR